MTTFRRSGVQPDDSNMSGRGGEWKRVVGVFEEDSGGRTDLANERRVRGASDVDMQVPIAADDLDIDVRVWETL